MTLVPRVALTATQSAHRVPGGTATSVLRLARELARRDDVDLTVVRARGDLRRPGSWRGRSADAAQVPGARSVTLPLPVPVIYDAWARSRWPSVTSAAGAVDLVHVTVPMRVAVGSAPMVATVHDLFPLTRPDDLTDRGARLMGDGLRWVLDHARAIMVPSDTVAAACAAHGVGEDRVSVVPWGTDPVEVGPAGTAAVRRRYGIPGPYVLFVGTREPRKNLDGLLAAMARLDRPGLTLVVVGPEGWGAASQPANAGLAGPVALLGHVPTTDLPALYAGAEVFCFPSFDEGFGLPVLEAMAAGAPVVTSSGTATADVAGGAAALVDPGDPVGIAAAIAGVLDDPAEADRLSAAGLARARSFRWDAAAAATVAAYRRALER